MSKKFKGLSAELQEAFDRLNEQQQKYIEYRAAGWKKKRAYTAAGYGETNSSQGACNLENRFPVIPQIIQSLHSIKESALLAASDERRALAIQEAKEVIAVTQGADSPNSQRIKFYEDIANGKTKIRKEIVKYDGEGKIIYRTVETIKDPKMQMEARRHLDNILGLNDLIEVGSVKFGENITINIVDASKKDALEDDRNKINMDIEGEIVTDEQ